MTSDGGQCCADDCCGPGSWCCARANPHEHDDAELGEVLAARAYPYPTDSTRYARKVCDLFRAAFIEGWDARHA